MKSDQANLLPYILGLDVGVRSIGWAIIDLRRGRPASIRRAGVRCFEAGVEGSIEQGKDSSRATQRRQARLARRQTWRRVERAKKVFRTLQRLGLLPPGNGSDPAQRHKILHELDAQLRLKHLCADDPVQAHLLPYRLRAKAAEAPLEPHAVGRALYHLAQRRGYLSNRKSDEKDDDEAQGQVKAGIADLEAKLAGRTLGQYFATLDPRDERIRRRWTSRQMYLDEFNRIWAVQAPGLGLAEEAKRSVYKAIFFQRPLRSQKGLIGRCELEPDARRAPQACLIAQEFRILQTVNHLRVRFPDGHECPLDRDERTTLIGALQDVSEMSVAAARKLLKLKKGATFTIEEFGEKTLPGNRTHARLAAILGSRWERMPAQERDQLVLEVLHYQKPSALVRRSMNRWGLSRDIAEQLSEVRLEPALSRHSLAALGNLVPLMREGKPYSTAKKEAYRQSFQSGKAMAILPPVLKWKPDLRNPAICRTLTELRKVVNAIIRLCGKPERIRIELARELKRSKKDRKRIADNQREQETKRKAALQKMLAQFPSYQPKAGFDPAIEKILLAEECNWECPFTGKTIGMDSLVGKQAQFDVAHLYPRRYLDDSFLNKTLCFHDVNRHRMHDLLPKQAFSSDADGWEVILTRVKAFKGPAARIKLERFQADAVPVDFVASQLNDTRYNSVVAAEYLGLLYGGLWDEEGTRRIETITGGITAMMRNAWRLRKDRNDHRHHAQDAIVLALIEPSQVAKLQTAVEIASARGERLRLGEFEEPWTGFCDHVRTALEAINVSFRCDRKLRGNLHAATNYSRPVALRNEKPARHVRKELHKLSPTEIHGEAIVDRTVRRLIQSQFERLGGKDPKKVFADPKNHPRLHSRDGRETPIHKVRLRVSDNPKCIGKGPHQRFVASGANSNHHCVVVAVLDAEGKEILWEGHVVPRLEANARLAKDSRLPVVQRFWGKDKRFKFTLAPNDMLTMVDERGVRLLYRVSNISYPENGKEDHELRLHNDARESAELRKSGQRIRTTSEKLRKAKAQKVAVGPLGDVVATRD